MKVLKFGAVWCPGCLVMRPRWEEIEKANPWIQTEYIDIDENPERAEKFQVNEKIPLFVFLDQNGQELERLQGEISKKILLEKINLYRDITSP